MMELAVSDHVHLRLHDKLLALLVWVGAAGIFASVGWMAVQPDDPRGAVSLVTRGGSLFSVMQIVVLAAVVSAIAAAVVGRKLPDAGVFAVALGLAATVLRGDTTSYLLISVAGGDAVARSSMAWRLALEGVIWFLPIATAIVASGVVTRWVHGSDPTDPVHACGASMLSEVPGLEDWLASSSQSTKDQPGRLSGLKTMVLSLLAAALIFRVLATGSPLRSVQHGQTYFALAAAFYLGGLIAYEVFPARTALWGVLSAPLLCLGGYLICAAGASPPSGYSQVASVPPSAFYRALPLEYVSVGAAASVAAFWSVRRSAIMRAVAA